MKRLLCLLLAALMLPAWAFALTAGDTGDEVLALQKRLRSLGLSTGSADGIYGNQTASAVEEAQRLLMAAGYGVTPTGVADDLTLALIHSEEAESALRTLLKGSRGDRVKDLQNQLIDLGILRTSADGVYGSQTAAAVSAFQKRARALGLNAGSADGVATPEVIRLLDDDLSQYGFRAPVYFDDSDPTSLTEDDLYAAACILIDAPSGQVLFEKNADAQMYPASTTKIMTLLVALENAGLNDQVTVPACAADIPADSSRVPVYPGEEMLMSDLLHGLMIRSGNDAANAIAELCLGSVSAFVDEMNRRAQELGMTGTHFVNPHGYHDEAHVSTARDLATVTRLGLTDAAFCRFATTLSHTLPETGKREAVTLKNSYEIFDVESELFIPGAAGVKSGYTSAAGFCYVGACQRGGETMIAVILGVQNRTRGWTDLRRLFELGFAVR